MAISKIESASLATGVPSRSQLPAGTVLQVVQGITTTQVSSSSSTYADTGLSATITPTSATSKILVVVDHSLCNKSTNNVGMQLKIQKNNSDFIVIAPYIGFTGNTQDSYFRAGCTYLDSPSTTSAITYKTQFGAYTNNLQVVVQVASTPSTITLMEIAA